MSAYRDYLKTLGTWSGTREEWNESLFKAGMTRAAELCRVEAEIHPANDYLLGKEAGCNDCADVIIKARDGE